MGLHDFLDMIGFSRHKINFRENIISTAGGFPGIFGIFMSNYWLLDPEPATRNESETPYSIV